MRKKQEYCLMCQMELNKDEIGITKKLIGEDIKAYYCLSCLADYLGAEQQDILDKIEEFKDQGCHLFD